MRTLKTEVEKGSVRTAIGHGLLDPKTQGSPLSMEHAPVSKGKEVNIPLAGGGHCGNTNKVRDAGMNPWESYLFFLTTL